MDLQINQREKEGIRILDLKGRVGIGQSEALLRDALFALAQTGAVNVILNFAEAKEIDDDGLGALVFCFAKLRRSGGALKLLNLSHAHMNLIVLTRLHTVFQIFTDEADAIDSFFPDRDVAPFDILEYVEAQEKLSSPDPPK
jgi:anti-sigma B factor antagonist